MEDNIFDVNKINNEILKDKNIKDINFYLLDTLEIVDKYDKLLKTPLKVSFMDNKPSVEGKEKNQLINQYISLLKNHDINGNFQYYKKHDEQGIECELCGNINTMDESAEINGVMICSNCGYQEKTPLGNTMNKITHHDCKRINICWKYNYDRKSHFINTINQFQGKNKNGIEDNIIIQVKNELKKYNILKEDETNKKDIQKSQISIIVKDLKLVNNYGDINLIHHLITGYPLNDITHLVEKLLDDFDQFVKMHYKKYSNEADRKNFNYQQLLFQLLLRHNYKCNPLDFNFLKTIDRKSYHDEIVMVIFYELGWNYWPIF